MPYSQKGVAKSSGGSSDILTSATVVLLCNSTPFLLFDILDTLGKDQVKFIIPKRLLSQWTISKNLSLASLGEWNELSALSSEQERGSTVVSASDTTDAERWSTAVGDTNIIELLNNLGERHAILLHVDNVDV